MFRFVETEYYRGVIFNLMVKLEFLLNCIVILRGFFEYLVHSHSHKWV